jgi:hypothetical protein
MPAEARHRLNAETATAKVIDGEAIVINVVTGRYYSLDGPGGVAWSLLVGGATAAEAGVALAERYDVEPDRAASDVERLAGELVAEDLIVQGRNGDGPSDLSPAAAGAPPAPYAAPVLLTFTDMEELLAFDPPLPPADYKVWESSEQQA